MARITLVMSEEKSREELFRDFVIENADEIASQINQILAHDQYVNALNICKTAVDDFYNDYDPYVYRRKHDLYNAFDVGIRGGEDFIFELGPDLMSDHHQPASYIYHIAFEEGYHGGPVWRTPIPFYTEELGPAPQMAPSPYHKIVDEWGDYLSSTYPGVKSDAISTVCAKYIRKFNRRR